MDTKSEYQGALANSKSGLRELLKSLPNAPKNVNKYWRKHATHKKRDKNPKDMRECCEKVREL
jgi:hypothetical protein